MAAAGPGVRAMVRAAAVATNPTRAGWWATRPLIPAILGPPPPGPSPSGRHGLVAAGQGGLLSRAMPPLTREQLDARRISRQRRAVRRDPRAIVSAAIPVIVVAVLALVLGIMGGRDPDAADPLASPVPPPELGTGSRPPDLVIARAEGVQVHIPVDPDRVTAAAFHPIDDPAGVGMESSGALRIHQAPRRDRVGPETAGLSVGAPAGTTVYAPVDGTIASVTNYTVLGKIEGYEITITPAVAASGLVLRMTHISERSEGARPSVGEPVRAGITVLGQVHDFSDVAEQEISQFTADDGNHVDLELLRTQAALIL